MTDLRTAAQQALEALEHGQHTLKQVSENQWESRGGLAMQALHAALAEKDPDSKHSTIAQWRADKQRKPLTDEEIHDCFQQKHKDKVTERRMITRAIERAHRINYEYQDNER